MEAGKKTDTDRKERAERMWKVLNDISRAACDEDLPQPEKLDLKRFELEGRLLKRRVSSVISNLNFKMCQQGFLIRRMLCYLGKEVPPTHKEVFEQLMEQISYEVGKEKLPALLSPGASNAELKQFTGPKNPHA